MLQTVQSCQHVLWHQSDHVGLNISQHARCDAGFGSSVLGISSRMPYMLAAPGSEMRHWPDDAARYATDSASRCRRRTLSYLLTVTMRAKSTASVSGSDGWYQGWRTQSLQALQPNLPTRLHPASACQMTYICLKSLDASACITEHRCSRADRGMLIMLNSMLRLAC